MIQAYPLKTNYKADIYLLAITLIWGLSFSIVKLSLNNISSLFFLAIRFWLGALLLLPFCLSNLSKQFNTKLVLNGSLLGFFLFMGMMFQTVGLRYTTASNSAFITGMAVIFVPVLVILIEHRLPRLMAVIGALIAVIGVFFLTQPQNGQLNRGDLFTFFGAISFAFEIVFIEKMIKEKQALSMAFLIVLATALFATISAVFLENIYIEITKNLVLGLTFVSIFCTALGFYIQAYWQPKTSATTAAVIYTMEPVSAALFAMAFFAERFNTFGWIGAGCIFAGILVSEIRKS